MKGRLLDGRGEDGHSTACDICFTSLRNLAYIASRAAVIAFGKA